MKRLTDKRLAIPPGQWQEVTREEARELKEIPVPPMRDLYYRLSQIEDILCDGTDEYDLDRLRELAEADREGRCVVLPRLETGQGDPPGEPGPPGLCPNCNGWRGLVWDKTTGGSRCTICGWTNAKT